MVYYGLLFQRGGEGATRSERYDVHVILHKFCLRHIFQALEMAGSDETEKALELQKQRERNLWLGYIQANERLPFLHKFMIFNAGKTISCLPSPSQTGIFIGGM